MDAYAGFSYALGCTDALAGRAQQATAGLARAYALVGTQEAALRARIAFELGSLYLAHATFSPVDVLLLGSETFFPEAPNPDLLHLRALAASAMGDDRVAEELYRAAIRANNDSLTPATTVLAMINLGASANQHDPDESVALTNLALELIAGNSLHPRMRAAANNVMGYGLICVGQFTAARARLEIAEAEASEFGNGRVAAYSVFNQAILDELEGQVDGAQARLAMLQSACAEELPDLCGWAAVRAMWLTCVDGSSEKDDSTLRELEGSLRSSRYHEALLCIRSVLARERGKLAIARAGFENVRRSASERGDVITEFAMLLHLVRVERLAGRHHRVRALARQATDLARLRAFRLSPNWWSADVVDDFREVAPEAAIASRLIAPASRIRLRQRELVELLADGAVLVAGTPLPLQWQTGKTGRRVLQRLYLTLLEAWPLGVPRDELADRLWPESDGDVAVRNLYAAANDLRKILGDVPGVALTLDAGAYALRLNENVRAPKGN